MYFPAEDTRESTTLAAEPQMLERNDPTTRPHGGYTYPIKPLLVRKQKVYKCVISGMVASDFLLQHCDDTYSQILKFDHVFAISSCTVSL